MTTRDWLALKASWEASLYATLVSEQDLIALERLFTYVDQEMKSLNSKVKVQLYGKPFTGKTYDEMCTKDKIDKEEFIGLFLEQFKVHKYIMKAQADKYSDYYESFYLHDGDPLVRYCKFQIPKNGNPLKAPGNLTLIVIDYHRNDRGIFFPAEKP